jgi:hypothetical protein
MRVELPIGPFNAAVKDGSIGRKMKAILDDTKPEAAYFTEMNGHRGAIMMVDMEKPSSVPKLAEPWFIAFDAKVEFHVVMNPEDLEEAGLGEIGKKWG